MQHEDSPTDHEDGESLQHISVLYPDAECQFVNGKDSSDRQNRKNMFRNRISKVSSPQFPLAIV